MRESGSGVNRRLFLAGTALLGAATTTKTLAAEAGREGADHANAAPGSTGAPVATPADEVVQTVAGKVRGYKRGDINVFKGIPYGDTTAGANRFMPPRKPKRWTNVFPAIAWGSVSPQGPNAQYGNPEVKWLLEWDTGVQGEDCLCLNVWTPSIRDHKKRPVMVWFHGGGFSNGSAQEFPAYDGEEIARRGDVVLVSVNHRLNLFGFLNLAGVGGERYAASGIAGLLDLVAALEWVRDNIGNFGGDPGNVTIFGQSGGGSKVTSLMAMPAARGLFHKAIAESGGTLIRKSNRAQTEQYGADVIKELGLTPATISRIDEMSVYELQQAVNRVGSARRSPGARSSPIAVLAGPEPLIDDKFMVSGEGVPAFSSGVPFMFGGTTHEMAFAVVEPALEGMSEDAVIERVEKTYPGKGRAIVAMYRQRFPTEKPIEIYLRIGAYGFTGERMNQMSELVTVPGAHTAPAYRFLFDWRTPALDGRPRAKHNSEIAFVFNNVLKSNPSAAGGAPAVQLGHQMSDAWTSFARTGNPNHPGLPRWEPLSAGHWPVMVFNTPPRVEDMVNSVERRAFA